MPKKLKKRKLTETAYALKIGDTFILASISCIRKYTNDGKKHWPGVKTVRVKIIEQ